MTGLHRRFLSLLGALLAASVPVSPAAAGDELQIKLAADPARDLVRSRCAACHSLDYIPMNAPFLPRAGWEAEVRKMIKVMGAPATDAEAATITDYLTAHYGAR
jgi:mono/diheme cytochrome c family protein